VEAEAVVEVLVSVKYSSSVHIFIVLFSMSTVLTC